MEAWQPGVHGAHAQWPVEMDSSKGQGHVLILHHKMEEMPAPQARPIKAIVQVFQNKFQKYLTHFGLNKIIAMAFLANKI